MDKAIANCMSLYFETMHEINEKLVCICNYNAYEDQDNSPKWLLDIIQYIPMLIPYCYMKGTLIVAKKDGLMEFASEIAGLR